MYFENPVQQINYGLALPNIRPISQRYIKQTVQTVGWVVCVQKHGRSLTMTKHAECIVVLQNYVHNAGSIHQKHYILTTASKATYVHSQQQLNFSG